MCLYIISQATINARTTGLRKMYWSFPTNGESSRDLLHQKYERKRQAGWGKRRDLISEDDDDDFLSYHPYIPHEYSVRTWFDDK